jgi:hypothetical protein
MTKNERASQLAKLIEMRPPEWLTKEIYSEYQEYREQHKGSFSMRLALNELFKDVPDEDFIYDQAWKSYQVHASPKILVDKYLHGEFISDPSSGQDPKILTPENLKTASFHAGNHWGWKTMFTSDGEVVRSSPAMWLQYGTFNIVKYNTNLIIEPCNVEHRCWGLIGFPQDLVQLKSDNDLWFYHNDLPASVDAASGKIVNRIRVNDLYLSEIVKKCNEAGALISKDSVLERFYKNLFKFQLLPFYNQSETEYFFKTINSSSAKSPAQLFHAESHEVMRWVKGFTSPKVTRFTPANKSLHPLFELMTNSELTKLEAMMITHTIIQFNKNGRKFVSHSDASVISEYKTTNGYSTYWDDDIKETILDDLDFLYSVISQSEFPTKVSKQICQHLLKTNDLLNEDGFIIADKKLFIDSFNEWFAENQNDKQTKQITLFAGNWRKSAAEEYNKGFIVIKEKFLQLYNIEHLKSLGIIKKSNSVPRLFDRNTIYDSYIFNKKTDIDGKPLTNAVGGHIISDMELIRMTKEERDEAFKLEKIDSDYEHELNCRAMSSYHNLRMGILRLSEYMSVISLDDSTLNKIKRDRYNELKKKPILV